MSAAEQAAFRNRKGVLSFNVLAVCTFDGRFQYVMSGWEGSAHDSQVLQAAIDSRALVVQQGQFWLGDAGYGLKPHVLTPYRSVRYHLREWRLRSGRAGPDALTTPQNREELFNLRHSTCRNAIERLFGVVKHRFVAFARGLPLRSVQDQAYVVYAMAVLHNYIRTWTQGADALEQAYLREQAAQARDVEPEDEDEGAQGMRPAELDAWRNHLAQTMWDQYQQYVTANITRRR